MTVHHCPCCGQELRCPGLLWMPLAGVLLRPADQMVAYFTKNERLLFDVVWQPYAAGSFKSTPFKKLLEAVYGDDPNGGPMSAGLCIYQVIHRIKKKIRPFDLALYLHDHAAVLCAVEQQNVHSQTDDHFYRDEQRRGDRGAQNRA